LQKQTPESGALGAANEVGICAIRGYSSSKRAQQDGSDEREYREHSQHIESQGKVHVTSSLDKEHKSNRDVIKF
jgi:hypothetical protein